MTRDEHDRATARLYAAAESRWRWQSVYVPCLRGLAWGVALAAILACVAVAGGNGCGDVGAEPLCVAGGEVRAGQDGPGHSGGVDCLPARVDPEAFALAARMDSEEVPCAR